MKATIKGDMIDFLKKTVETFIGLGQDTALTFDKDNVNFFVFNKFQGGFIEIDKAAFDKYEITDKISLGIKLSDLKDVVGKASNEDVLEFDDEFVKGQLRLVLTTPIMTKTYDVNLLSETPICPWDFKKNLKFPKKITMDADLFKSIIEEFDNTTDIDISIFGNDKILIELDDSRKTKSAKIELKTSEQIKIETKGDVKSVKSKYGIDLLKHNIPKKMGNGKVIFYIGDGMPIMNVYQTTNGNAELAFVLAPRVSDGKD